MALPTKSKTWTISPNNVVYDTSGALQIMSSLLLAVKNSILGMSGVTVKGSCNGTTGAMDAVDRWSTIANVQTRASSTTAAQSWIVLDLANMGGAELLISYWGSGATTAAIYFSPGGNYTLAGTSTHKPTATDEVTISISTALITTGNHLWTTWLTSDGSALWFAFAAGGTWRTCIGLQLVTSRVTAGTFSPAAVGIKLNSSSWAISTWSSPFAFCRLDPGGGAVNIDGYFGIEGAKTGIAATLYPGFPELQGAPHIFPVSVWSETSTARGAVCWLTDVWAGNTDARDGDFYPNAVTRSFVQLGDFILPWGGTPILMVA